MRQHSKSPHYLTGFGGLQGPIHRTIVTGRWVGVVRSCLGVIRINFHIDFIDFYVLVRPINRKT